MWWLDIVLAATPILLILVVMVFLKKSAAVAGIVGLVPAVILSGFYFGFHELEGVRKPVAAGIFGATMEAGFAATTILWIIFGALFLYQLQVKTGAIEALRDGIGSISTDRRVVAILIAWFFTIFLEGAAGFGTPVALAAPFLVGLGFRPVQAVVIALIGHSAGVAFGAVGTPVMVQEAVTPWTGIEIAGVTGNLQAILGPVILVYLLVMVTIWCREEGVKFKPIAGWFALAAASYLVPMWAIAQWVGPELPTLGGALIGGVIFVLIYRRRKGGRGRDGEVKRWAGLELWVAASPYLVLVALIVTTRLVAPLRALLETAELRWTLFEVFTGSVEPIAHPGTLLVISVVVGGVIQGATRRDFVEALRAAGKMLIPVTVALVAMLVLSRLMVHGAMIEVLADGAASVAGGIWPVFSPLIGGMGSFVTGSATASNILVTDFQVATAEQLEMDGLTLVGAQGVGAALGKIISPQAIITGCATVEIAGREGEVMRATLGAFLVLVGMAGVVVWVVMAQAA